MLAVCCEPAIVPWCPLQENASPPQLNLAAGKFCRPTFPLGISIEHPVCTPFLEPYRVVNLTMPCFVMST
jgi:hypothetical protein